MGGRGGGGREEEEDREFSKCSEAFWLFAVVEVFLPIEGKLNQPDIWKGDKKKNEWRNWSRKTRIKRTQLLIIFINTI